MIERQKLESGVTVLGVHLFCWDLSICSWARGPMLKYPQTRQERP